MRRFGYNSLGESTMSTELELSREMEQAMRRIAREEVERWSQGVRDDWSLEKMQAAMRRLCELRKTISIPPDVVDDLIEEHRREFGRGE
jgi:hypothetical protein